MSRSQLRQERDCASEASRSNGGIETSEGDFYAWSGDKLSPLRSGWGQLVPTSSERTAESNSAEMTQYSPFDVRFRYESTPSVSAVPSV